MANVIKNFHFVFLTPSDRLNKVSRLVPWERNLFRATNPVAKAVEMCMMAKMIQVHNTWVSLGCPVTYFPDPSANYEFKNGTFGTQSQISISDDDGRPLDGSAGCPENVSHNMIKR